MSPPATPSAAFDPSGMASRHVTLRLPLDLIEAVETEARAREVPSAVLLRAALIRAFSATEHLPPTHLCALRAALDEARGWLDLQVRLRAGGLVLRLGLGARLAVHDWPADRFLIWLDTLGPDLAELTLRFRAPFPGATGRAQPLPGQCRS